MAQGQISGVKKAAILMDLMGDEASAGVFRFIRRMKYRISARRFPSWAKSIRKSRIPSLRNSID